MKAKVLVPEAGESIVEGVIHQWHVESGDYVSVDDVLFELETDKVTMEVTSEESGEIVILREKGSTVKIGEEVATIDTDAAPREKDNRSGKAGDKESESPVDAVTAQTSPTVRKTSLKENIDLSDVKGSGRNGRILASDLSASPKPPKTDKPLPQRRDETLTRREPLSMLRKKVAERLVNVQNSSAILTTFNEVDMSEIIRLRKRYGESFKQKYGISLGFMNFFISAATTALKEFPRVNAWIDGDDVVYHDYYNLGVAVSTDDGLMVPVVKDADKKSPAQIELEIAEYATRARTRKISLEDLSGGTFTISNGGVFGSLMSTPILNPPQSGILGMHKIQERAVVEDGEIVIRPMMYLALSYDHRIIDGRESVSFLVRIKELIEDPSRIFIGV